MDWNKRQQLHEREKARFPAFRFIKYLGPGLLVTIGFIDPGNWATDLAAGSTYGYSLLWVVALATLMLIVLQHNAAHLGIVTGYCLSEAAAIHLKPWVSMTALGTAMLAAIATALAEILGAAVALNMLFHLPLQIGAVLAAGLVAWLLLTNSYRQLEKIIIGFVSLIGLAFLIELSFVHVHWPTALIHAVVPEIPKGSMLILMSVLGAVVMPHNMFLHSEIIQSRAWHADDARTKEKRLKYEFLDTVLSMIVGWAINSAIILVAAATFFQHGIKVNDLAQAHKMLHPLLGNLASVIFAAALLFAGISALITAGMAGGTIYAGIYREPYHIKDSHTRLGVALTILPALLLVCLIGDPFRGLIYSQMALSIQLPFTVFLQITITSSRKMMGEYANSRLDKILLWTIGLLVVGFNLMLLGSVFR